MCADIFFELEKAIFRSIICIVYMCVFFSALNPSSLYETILGDIIIVAVINYSLNVYKVMKNNFKKRAMNYPYEKLDSSVCFGLCLVTVLTIKTHLVHYINTKLYEPSFFTTEPDIKEMIIILQGFILYAGFINICFSVIISVLTVLGEIIHYCSYCLFYARQQNISPLEQHEEQTFQVPH